MDEKLYFEIPYDMLDREMLLVSRIARTATSIGFGGQKTNTQTVRWQRHNNDVLLRIVSYVNVADGLSGYQCRGGERKLRTDHQVIRHQGD